MDHHAQLAGIEAYLLLLTDVPDLGGHGIAGFVEVQITARVQGGAGIGQEYVAVADAGFLGIAAWQDLHQEQAVVGQRGRWPAVGSHKGWITQGQQGRLAQRPVAFGQAGQNGARGDVGGLIILGKQLHGHAGLSHRPDRRHVDPGDGRQTAARPQVRLQRPEALFGQPTGQGGPLS